MGNHTLLLHMGLPKTGTSALQRFLYCNAECLKKYGWSYPDLKTVVGDANSYYMEFINATVLYKAENVLDIQSENWIRSWTFLKKELEKYNVILSSEIIYEWGGKAFLQEALKEYQNIKVIIYLRRQDIFLESYWAQWVKSDGYVKEFEEGKREFEHYAHYLDLLHSICTIIGKENLILRVYEKGQYRGDRNDIFSDFFDAIGMINVNWSDFYEVGTINKSLYGNYIEIRRIFNTLKEIDIDFLKDYRKYFLMLSNRLPKEEKVQGYFESKAERESFLDQFKEENRIIAEQFIHNEDGILFNDMNTDIPFTGVKASKFEEDIIRLFGLIVCSEVKEIKQRISFLEKSSKWTADMLIDLYKKERKIVLFGGGQKCRELLKEYSWDVVMVIDNNENKSGSQIEGITIVNFLSINNWKEFFIIITCVDSKDIEEQLKAKGLLKGKDFVVAREFLY